MVGCVQKRWLNTFVGCLVCICQMFRLTIRSSKEAVTNEVAELLVDQF